MPVSIKKKGNKADLLSEWLDLDGKNLEEALDNVALALWRTGRGPKTGDAQKPFADLSEIEKLEMVFDYLTEVLEKLAEAALIETDTDEARKKAKGKARDKFKFK